MSYFGDVENLSELANDIINMPTVLKITYDFLMGRKLLLKKNKKKKKKIVSVALPFSDLVFAVWK